MYKVLEYRPFVDSNTGLLSRIANRNCWHFDAWLRRHVLDNSLYIVIRTSRGGKVTGSGEYLRTTVFKIRPSGRLQRCDNIDAGVILAMPWACMGQLGDTERALMEQIHRAYIVSWCHAVPSGFRGRSVCLHYIQAGDAPAINPDTVNYYRER